MDFRTIGRIQWSASGQARAEGGGAVVAQTPRCACRVSVVSAGMYRLQLQLPADSELHAAFARWLREAEDSACQSPALEATRANRTLSTTVWNDSMRLTAFSDTLAFDAEARLSPRLVDATAATCIIRLQGVWTTQERWGLRWQISQVKFDTEGAAAPPPPKRARREAFGFVDED